MWKIANQFGVTPEAIRVANNLKSDVLQIGQVLVIPNRIDDNNTVPGENTNTYTVQNGDSLWKIASRFGTTINALKSANNLTNDNLRIGQVLIIPNTGNIGGTTYIVKNGDSLWKIANQYGITVNELKSANNLTGDNLSVGQVLKVPQSESSSNSVYVVKNGDSLWKIANQYGTTVSRLKEVNNLTSNDLKIGQIIRIP